MSLTGAVEGPIDEAVLRKICEGVNRPIELVYVTDGKQNLLQRLRGFNEAARYAPWVVFIDLNGTVCAPVLCQETLPEPAPKMCYRVAVRAIESWIMADREGLARFLSISVAAVPQDPDGEADPKETLVNLARTSRKRAIREDIVPSKRSGRRVGPAYVARLTEFVLDPDRGWRADIAATRSESLDRCLRALHALQLNGSAVEPDAE